MEMFLIMFTLALLCIDPVLSIIDWATTIPLLSDEKVYCFDKEAEIF